MREITENSQLEAGRHYHCFNRQYTSQHSIVESREDEGRLYLGNRIWAFDDNSQALPRWRIFGPIEMPTLEELASKGPWYCKGHGGHGFRSECYGCKTGCFKDDGGN